MVRLSILIIVCMILSGCHGAQLKKGGLYVNQDTCVGMDELGVAKIKSGF